MKSNLTKDVQKPRVRCRHYLEHFVKRAEGSHIETEKAAAIAGLVSVPSQASVEELREQVRKGVSGEEHD